MSDDFPELLDHLLARNPLDEIEAETLMDRILTGELGPERLAALITALRAKGPHEDELVGFARSMRNHSHHVPTDGGPVLDNCGTGGAPHKTFNVSTAAAFVLAADGITVAKHGNRSVTRPSGSADVLERAGADLTLGPQAVGRVLQEAGIAFLFAPTFHPAMRHAGPVRGALGIKTVFNLLGPLTNPAEADRQVLGVYDPGLLPLMGRALGRLGCRSGFVLHGDPGYDEATPVGTVRFIRIEDGHAGPVRTVDPLELGLPRCTPEHLLPVAATDAPARLRSILSGKAPGPLQDTVALNVAFGLVAAGRTQDLRTGVERAQELLAAGVGNAKLDTYLAATRSPE